MSFIKIQVTLKTTSGEFTRDSEAYEIPASQESSVTINGGVLNYPDLRCTQFEILTSATEGGTYGTAAQPGGEPAIFPAVRSTANNLAYALVPAIDSTPPASPSQKSGKTAIATGTGNTDRDANQILVSEPFKLQSLLASNALYAVGDEEDQIMRFEANTRPVSDGQFGFAPLLVLSKKSVQALEVGEALPFVRTTPLADRGCVSRYGSTNANGIIFMVSSDGIWILTPAIGDLPVSLPLHGFDLADDLLDELDADTVAVYVDDGRGNREVRVTTGSTTYCYSFEYSRWFTLDRGTTLYLRDEENLYAYDVIEQQLTEELQMIDVGQLTPAGVEFRIRTATFKLGFGGDTKRFYRIALRQRGELDETVYLALDPLDVNNLGGEVDSVVSTADTAALAVYIDSLTINSPGSLDINNPMYVVDQEEGAVVAAGYFHRGGNTDSMSLEYSIARDLFLEITGKGKPGQSIEGIEFDFEPRYLHRARRRNYTRTA